MGQQIEITQNKLDDWSMLLRESLSDGYRQLLRCDPIAFDNFPNLQFTPDKPNTARTIIPVRYAGNEVAKMYAIVFAPGDGTGDFKTYTPDQVQIPEEWNVANPERVMPRKKTCALEAFFPFFTIFNGRVYQNSACLEEIGLDPENEARAKVLWHLGSNPGGFYSVVNNRRTDIPRVQLTTGKYPSQDRFGDPHAIYANPDYVDTAIQVVGFLAVEKQIEPLYPVFDSFAEKLRVRRS